MTANTPRAGLRRIPVWMMLVSLALLPSLLLVGVGVESIREKRSTVAATERVRALTETFVALADLRAGLTDEQIFMSSEIVQRQLGIPTELVVEVVGSDVTADKSAAVDRVTRAHATALATDITHIPVGDGRNVSDVLEGYAALVATRDALAAGTLDFEAANLRYSRFRNEIFGAIAATSRELNEAANGIPNATRLRRLVNATKLGLDVSESMSIELIGISSALVAGLSPAVAPSAGDTVTGGAVPGSIQLSADRRRIEVRELGALLEGELREKFDRIRQDPSVAHFEASIDAALQTGVDPSVMDKTQLAKEGLRRLKLTSALVPEMGTAVSEEASVLEGEAERQRDSSMVLTAVLLILTGAIALAVSLGITRPLGRLHNRAIALRDGDLDAPQSAPGGPAEVYEVGRTFNEIVESLRAVERRASAMVDGDPTATEEDLHGPLGASVQQTIERLGEVTERLKVSEALSNAIVATAAEAIWTLWSDGRIRTANAAAQRLTGLSVGEMVGRPFVSLLVDGYRLPGGSIPRELRGVEVLVCREDGEIVPMLVSSARVDLDGESLFTVFGRDITERKHFEARLAEHALTDPLTGLANRRAAIDAIGEAMSGEDGSTEHQAAVIFCDLDGFKQANDTYGHGFGDWLLAQVATRFQRVLRHDDVLARLGGDEFVVIMRSEDARGDAGRLAERLLAGLEAPFLHQDAEARLSGSIGIACSTRGMTPLELLRNADVAMYVAKTAGGSQYRIFDTELEEEERRRLDIERGLRHAIDHDELELHYQPIADAQGHHLVGMEALVRWNRPGVGLMPPADFIPIAEASGTLIVDLGRWVMREAARQIARWNEQGVHTSLPVSVNVSGAHLMRHDVVNDVQAAFEAAGVEPSRLRLELTETQLVSEVEAAATALRRLAEIGVTVAIDDYGTGYSSITYLRQLPVHAIKIDRSYIAQLDEDRPRALVESMVSVAVALGLEVVAEGVETEEQLTTVAALGCTAAQGWHIGRPAPAVNLPAPESGLVTGRAVERPTEPAPPQPESTLTTGS